MICSLVSAPTLGFDLVRHPSGPAVATILLRALSCGPGELPVFAAARSAGSADARADALARVHAAVAAVPAGAAEPKPLPELICELRDRMIVELDDLNRLLREDVFAWAQSGPVDEAGAVFFEAIAAVWTSGLPAFDQRLLAEPFLDAARRIPSRDPDVGPQHAAVHDILAALSGLSADDRARLRATAATLRPADAQWAAAMHEASWATFTTGRIRVAAAAQFMAVSAFRTGGLDATDGAEGVWNAVSGHVHATVMADVLPDRVSGVLGEVWRTAFR